MKIKMKGAGRPPGFACVVTLVLCLFAGLLFAGPLRSDHNDHTGTLMVSGPHSGHHTHTGTHTGVHTGIDTGTHGSHHSEEHRSGHHTHTGTQDRSSRPHHSGHHGHTSVVHESVSLTRRDVPSHHASHPHGHTGTSDLSGGPHHSGHHGHTGTSELPGDPHRSGHHGHTSHDPEGSLTRRAMPSHHPSGFHGHTGTAPHGHGPPAGRPHSAAAHHQWHDWNPSGSHGAPHSHTMAMPGASGFRQSGHNAHTMTRPNMPHLTGSHTGTSHRGHPSVMSGRPSATALLSFGTTSVMPAFTHATATASDSADFLLESRDALAKHDYALVCESDREATMACMESDYGYYCTSNGKLAHTGDKVSFCDKECQCINLAPKSCIHGIVLTTCFVKVDGTIVNSQFEVIGSLGDAVVDTNGTLTLPRSLPSSETDLVPASMTLSPRDSDAADHDWALICADRDGTTRCEKRSYFCKSSGQVSYKLSDYFCDMVCECKSLSKPAKGCVIVNADKNPKIVCASKRDTDALSVDDGTTSEPNQALSKRDTDIDDVYHDYAMVCNDRKGTSICASASYSCSANGKLTYKEYVHFCSVNCECRNLKRQYCIQTNFVGVFCEMVSKKTVQNETESNEALSKRDTDIDNMHHDYALVCIDKQGTTYCLTFPYSCNANGNLIYQSYNRFCSINCKCVNLKRQYCIQTNYVGVFCEMVSKNTLHHENGTFIGHVKDAVILPNGTFDFSHTRARRDLQLSATSSESNASQSSGRSLLFCQNGEHTRTCNQSPFSYCCHASNLTAQSHDSVCDDICQCFDLRRSPQPRYCTVGPNPTNHTECYVVGNSVYKIEGEMLTDFLGNFTDAAVDHNANLWLPSPGHTRSLPPDMFSPEPFAQPAVIKRDEDDADETQVKWNLLCINKQHTKTCRSSPFAYTCDRAQMTFKNWDFVCQQICNCIDHDPSQICIPTNTRTGQCPPGGEPLSPEQRDPPNGPKERDLKGIESGEPSKRSAYHILCYSGNRFNGSLTTHCMAESYTCNPPSPDLGRLFPALAWNGPGEAQCSQGCRCRAPYASEDLSARSSGSGDYSLVCKGRLDRDAIVPGFQDVIDRCRNRWGYTCDGNGHMQHNGTSIHQCDTSCSCSNIIHNGTTHTVKERSESLDKGE